MSSIAIKTNQLSKKFGTRTAVSDLSIEIQKGEIFSLLGTNGAGKTTTIKLLSCLLKPTSGSATLMGIDVEKHPDKVKKIIGVSPQETAIATHLNTRENLTLMGGIFNMSPKAARSRAYELMQLMELEDRKDQVRKLSGGMQRRLSIAMALMANPEILFLDEPTLGLDPHARKSVWNYIEKLKGEKTILLTTHYLEEADSLADHIAIMEDAKIIETGTSQELKKRYQSSQIMHVRFDGDTTQVIGELRQLNIEVENNSQGIVIKAPDLDIYAITDVLRSKNIVIKGIQMQEPTLDEVFIHLTGKEAKS
ncbi:MAG: ATP-binding cassette domain-containing protein [Prolixibacteraceae bacterium]